MQLEVPDAAVWAVMAVILAATSVYVGIKIGNNQVAFSAAPRNNSGASPTKRRKKKSKAEGLKSPAPLQMPEKGSSDADGEDESTLDDGETSAETRSEVAQSSPQAQANTPSSGGQTVPKTEKSGNMSVPEKEVVMMEKKEKDKKKKKKKETAQGQGEAMGVATEKEIEKEVVAESVSQVIIEEVSAATATVFEEGMAYSVIEEAQADLAVEKAAVNAPASGADDDGEWEVVEKRAQKKTNNQARPSSVVASSHREGSKNGKGEKGTKGKEGNGGSAPSSSSRQEAKENEMKEEVVALPTEVITVDIKHLGAIIGTKGTTRLGLEKLYSTQIKVPKSERSGSGPIDVTIQGPEDGIKATISAIHQLCEKGYAPCLGGDGFSEGAVQVHPIFVSEIVGKNGSSARAIQDQMGVKLVIPQHVGGNGSKDLVRVGIAGQKEKVKKAKELIKDLIKYHHTEVTHPGYDHIELDDVPTGAHSHIIGKKGSEISKIQTTFGVFVYIPYEHSATQNVVLVGEEREKGLQEAKAYIHAIVEKYESCLRAKEEAAAAKAATSAMTAESATDTATATATESATSVVVTEEGAASTKAAASTEVEEPSTAAASGEMGEKG